MIKGCKICGIKDSDTLNFIINHPSPPTFIGFICNYPKSSRYVKLEDLKKLLSFLKISPNNLPKNISISRNYNIKKDMMKTSFVLYRGSGAVIDCVSNGLTPIYLNIQKNVNIDPIYKIKTNNYVTSIQDFKKLTDLHINKKRLNYNLSRKINNNYLQKLKINKLIKFINKFK